MAQTECYRAKWLKNEWKSNERKGKPSATNDESNSKAPITESQQARWANSSRTFSDILTFEFDSSFEIRHSYLSACGNIMVGLNE
jgi:hypothetical protein